MLKLRFLSLPSPGQVPPPDGGEEVGGEALPGVTEPAGRQLGQVEQPEVGQRLGIQLQQLP